MLALAIAGKWGSGCSMQPQCKTSAIQIIYSSQTIFFRGSAPCDITQVIRADILHFLTIEMLPIYILLP